mgnify:CR=1 FL=1
MRFEVLDVSGDVGIKAYGITIEDAFISAGTGMYSLITDIKKVSGQKDINIDVKGISLEGLLVSYLNELIYLFDTYNFIGAKIEIISSVLNAPDYRLMAKITGEEFEPQRHERRLLIKAATYHNIKVDKVGDRWEIEVIFDI